MAPVEEKKESISKETSQKKVTLKAKKEIAIVVADHADIAYRVLVQPWITEKTHSAMAMNKYAFKVTRTATKKEVTKAIEGMYKVTVEKIAMINVKAKIKAYGRYARKQAGLKKAIITLKQGDKIELFQGA